MKKIVVFIISFFIFLGNVLAYDFDIKSDKVIMVNLNEDMILYQKNENEKASIASLTKIITAITIIDNQSDLNKMVTIKSNMLAGLDGYAKLGLKVGDKISYFDLLYALMLPSSADAGQALAIDMSGSIDEFANLMNKEVEKIGVNNSHFTNPVGIDDSDNYSTASDLYLILKYALKNETFRALFEAKEHYLSTYGKTVYKTINNTANQYNIDIHVIKGAKTGFTYDAGLCLATTSSANGVDYLMVVLNAPVDTLYHINDTINLYSYYIDNYEYITIINKNDLFVTIPVKKSDTKELSFYADKDIQRYLKKDFDKSKLKKEYTGIDKITSKLKKGDKIGTIEYKYENEVLYKTDIYLTEDIKYYNYTKNIVILIIIVIFILYLVKKILFKKRKRKGKK